MRTALLLCLLLCVPIVLVAASPPLTKDNVHTFYQKFRRMTSEPYQVKAQVSDLCSTPRWDPVIVDGKLLANGHAVQAIQVYMNEPAAKAFESKTGVYPEGSVVVKEKVGLGEVGGMIKREKGFDAEHGDWEYFYARKDEEPVRGKMQNCMECHTGAKNRDYVFGRWQSKAEKDEDEKSEDATPNK